MTHLTGLITSLFLNARGILLIHNFFTVQFIQGIPSHTPHVYCRITINFVSVGVLIDILPLFQN